MERWVADVLNQETARFYQAQAASFSGTRKVPWPGWFRCAELLRSLAPRVRLLDLACGNLRFERFLADRMPDVEWSICAVDSCEELVGLGRELASGSIAEASSSGGKLSAPGLASGEHSAVFAEGSVSSIDFSCQQIDVVAALLDGSDALGLGCCGLFDACVSFGFLHHVPGFEARMRALRELVEQARPGGLVFVSLWQFEKSPSILAQAQELRGRALDSLGICESDLEAGDYLLGWNKASGTYRYCHSFSAAEVNRLLDGVADLAEPVDVFESDGRTGNMNTYLVLERR